MDHKVISALYSRTAGHPRTDYRLSESHFAVDRMQHQLESVVKPGTRVLDLGCNAGRFCFHSETMGATAVGVDCTMKALQCAVEIKKDMGSNAGFIACHLPDLPFQDATFDLAVFPENIIYFSIEEMRLLGENLSRVLRPGGLFCPNLQDAIEQVASHQHWLERYDAFTG